MKALNFTLPYIDKEGSYQLKSDLGKIIVLTFWTSWCPACGSDLPLKEKLYQTVDSEKVKFITINVAGRERTPNEGLHFHNNFLTQPTLVDRGLEVYRQFNCLGVPTTVIINQDGEIITQLSDHANPIDMIQTISPYI
ncbi:TlpA family protein disulfide reductase [Amphibacillus sp. Q70]|uniref:TlpA family protein disulfide reductase n=1 Tax=Amphibacillus sp. Q70 TaxID=3453416 RepID=UPI003F83138B